MKITVELSKEDWLKYHKYLSKSLFNSARVFSDSFLFNVMLWMIIAFAFMAIFRDFEDFHPPTAGLVLGIIVCLIVWLSLKKKRYTKAFEPKQTGAFIGKHHFDFDESGIHSYNDNYDAKHSWRIVQEIRRDSGMIMIFIDTAMAFIFPENKLEDPDVFFNKINDMFKHNTTLKGPQKT